VKGYCSKRGNETVHEFGCELDMPVQSVFEPTLPALPAYKHGKIQTSELKFTYVQNTRSPLQDYHT
jgi:hypothetical protein